MVSSGIERSWQLVMTKIHPLFLTAAFDVEVTHVMGDAFDHACRALRDQGQPPIVREVIAQRIIALAKAGEHDPNRLCERALNELGFGRNADRRPHNRRT
jgi:hypothetical protein